MTETRITVPIEIIVRIGVAPSPPVAAPAGDLVV
jgi:hypothetical protein